MIVLGLTKSEGPRMNSRWGSRSDAVGGFCHPHLAGVQPVVEFLLALDAGQDQAVEDVLAQRGE